MAAEPHTTPVVFLMGPTGAGKSALAMEIARRLPIEIISVDSAMVYRDMDIGTAKPSANDRSRVRHHLLDLCDPAEPYSAGRFRADARAALESAWSRGAVPVLAGGTGLYFRALQQGFSALPPADDGVRQRLAEQLRTHGSNWLHEQLRRVDPVSAARIHPNDPQRLQRALEVFELTGRPLSATFAAGRGDGPPLRVVKIILAHADRGRLHRHIETRFLDMLEAGLVGEVERLYRRPDLGLHLPSIRMVGYRQVWHFLAGALSQAEMTADAITATRRLAKRQMTWLRAETGACPVPAGEPDLLHKTLKIMQLEPDLKARM